ncbi:hypothetical protein HN873_043519 [Arachis hypogaea]
MKQIHDLQEHIQEKDRQLIELQEQHRVAQETLMYKDEQLREAQTWINRVVRLMFSNQQQTSHCRLDCGNVQSSITSSRWVSRDRFISNLVFS